MSYGSTGRLPAVDEDDEVFEGPSTGAARCGSGEDDASKGLLEDEGRRLRTRMHRIIQSPLDMLGVWKPHQVCGSRLRLYPTPYAPRLELPIIPLNCHHSVLPPWFYWRPPISLKSINATHRASIMLLAARTQNAFI